MSQKDGFSEVHLSKVSDQGSTAVRETALDPTSSPLRIPEYRRYFISRSIADIGTHSFRAALIWYVTEEASLGVSLGHILLALSLPQALFAIFGGALGDRYGRKLTIIACDFVSFGSFVLLCSLAATGALASVSLIALVFTIGVCFALLGPSASTIIPSVVPKETLQKANALCFSTSQIIGMAVPAVAGMLIVLIKPQGIFLINAFCFFLAAIIFLPARISQPVPPRSASGLGADLKSGIRATFSSGWLASGVSAAVLTNFLVVAPQSALVPLMISQAGLGPGVLGIYLSSMGVGILGGSFLSGRLSGAYAMPAIVASLVTLGIVSFLYLLPLSLPLILLVSVVKGAALGVFEVTWATTMQKRVAQELLSRVYSVQASLSFASRSLSLAAVGYAMVAVEPGTLIGLLAGMTLLFALAVARTLIRT